MTSVKDIMREPAKPKRNFLRENKGQIHKIEQKIRGQKDNAKEANLKSHKYANVKSKVNTALNREYTKQSSAESMLRVAEPCLHPAWYHESSKTVGTCDEAVQVNELSILASVPKIHQSTQTFDSISQLCDGKIMTPSDRPWRSASIESLHIGEQLNELTSQYTQRSHSSAENAASSHFQLGDRLSWPTKSVCKTSEKDAENPMKAPATYQRGVVPRYIRERQEEQLREAERILRSAPDPECPLGHRQLAEQDRLDKLASLKTTQADLIVKLNRLPVHQDTLRSQNHRKQIDEELNKLERLILAFSKTKVFIEISPRNQN